MARAPDWDTDGADWPNRSESRFVQAGGLQWHVQVMGSGPALLLVHGTGAATHSWRDLAPLLAKRFTVIAPDLPGHGFTQSPPTHQLSLSGMAAAMTSLLGALDVQPEIAVGHSAGAAILVRMCQRFGLEPRVLVSLNGALVKLKGPEGHYFAPVAKLLALTPLVPNLFAWRASDKTVVRRLIEGTGSTLDPGGLAGYAVLARCPGHASAALGMMANWDLATFQRELHTLSVPLVLIVGDKDKAIPPEDAERVQAILPESEIVHLEKLGHLAHEEAPERVAKLIEERFDAFASKDGTSS